MEQVTVSDQSLTMGLDVDAHSSFVEVRDGETGRIVDHRRVVSGETRPRSVGVGPPHA